MSTKYNRKWRDKPLKKTHQELETERMPIYLCVVIFTVLVVLLAGVM